MDRKILERKRAAFCKYRNRYQHAHDSVADFATQVASGAHGRYWRRNAYRVARLPFTFGQFLCLKGGSQKYELAKLREAGGFWFAAGRSIGE
jgi:hypothetical protein